MLLDELPEKGLLAELPEELGLLEELVALPVPAESCLLLLL